MKNSSFFEKFVESLIENTEERRKVFSFYNKFIIYLMDFPIENEIFIWCLIGFIINFIN